MSKIKNLRIFNDIINNKKKLTLTVFLLILVPAIIIFAIVRSGGDTSTYEYQMDEIKRTIFSGTTAQEISDSIDKLSPTPTYAIFVSVSDGKAPAEVCVGTGKTLSTAWSDAYENGEKTVKRFGIKTKWVRVDIVDSYDTVTYEELSGTYLKNHSINAFKYGLAFDTEFKYAILAEEINANSIIDYDDDNRFSLARLNKYLKNHKRDTLDELPTGLRVFTTSGYIYDSGNVHKLMNNEWNYSVRKSDASSNISTLKSVINDTAEKLAGSVNSDGYFTYGYSPVKNISIKYTIGEHSQTISALAEKYKIDGNDEIKSAMESAAKYLVSNILSPSDDIALIKSESVDAEDEVYLGDTALATIALIDYSECLKSNTYDDLINKLGAGIELFLDEESGAFEHTLLYPSLEPDDCYRDDKFNAMAAYALCRLYSYTGQQAWIDDAACAANYIIALENPVNLNKWHVLALRELGDNTGSNIYYSSALSYVNDNVSTIASGAVFSPDYLDLLIAGYEIYDKNKGNETLADDIRDFDIYTFTLTAVNYTDFIFNKYYYPENAMYLENSAELVGNFYSSDDCFSTDAGVMQGYLYSLCRYYNYYDKLTKLYDSLK